MPQLSYASDRLVGQRMFQILAKAQELERAGSSMLHFEIGEPNFMTPTNVSEVAVNAIRFGDTHYVNSMGLLELRLAAINTTEKSRNFRPDLSQILVTPGANVQIYLALACAVNPGEEVIIPDPGFVSYASIIQFIGAIPVRVPLREKNEFRLDPDDVEAAITSRTRMIIINSPSNPTGAVMTEDQMQGVFRLARHYNIFLLSDEIYARMVFFDENVAFHSPSKYDACRENTIIVNGFSKSYAMTGWRLGVVTGPSELIAKMGLLLETTLSCTPPFTQRAGIAALEGSQAEIDAMILDYEKRRNVLVEGLNSIPGIRCSRPSGAFYVFPNIKDTGLTSDEVADLLMNKAGVVVSPGNIFGANGEGYIRLCYANSIKNIEKAIVQMRKVLA